MPLAETVKLTTEVPGGAGTYDQEDTPDDRVSVAKGPTPVGIERSAGVTVTVAIDKSVKPGATGSVYVRVYGASEMSDP